MIAAILSEVAITVGGSTMVAVAGQRLGVWHDVAVFYRDLGRWLTGRRSELAQGRLSAEQLARMEWECEIRDEAGELVWKEQPRDPTEYQRRHGRGWTTGSGPAPTRPPQPRRVTVHRFDHGREMVTEELQQ